MDYFQPQLMLAVTFITIYQFANQLKEFRPESTILLSSSRSDLLLFSDFQRFVVAVQPAAIRGLVRAGEDII